MNPNDHGTDGRPGGPVDPVDPVNPVDSMNDVHGEALRRVLRAEANRMDPAEPIDGALNRIRTRTEAAANPGRRWLAPLAAAAAVAVVVAVGAAVLPRWLGTGLGATSSASHPSGSPTGTPSGSSPSVSPSTSATSTATGRPGTVPVYFGGTFAGHTMLYREFHQSTATQQISGAVKAMLAGPVDPDYSCLWPAGTTLTSLSRTGATVTVTLSAAPLLAQPTAGVYGASSVQEVVYTVTAADPTVRAVTVVYPGGESTAVTRAPGIQVLASVWVLGPTQGATVSSPVTISGTAAAFEATVAWQVDRLDGTVAARGSAMTTIGAPGRGPWSTVLTLPPGTYVVRAYVVSAKDGSITWPDTKTFTIR